MSGNRPSATKPTGPLRGRLGSPKTAIVLTGGGARAVYQVGVLSCLARHLPEFRFDCVTGVSAGAINAVFMASHPGTVAEAVEDLVEIWKGYLRFLIELGEQDAELHLERIHDLLRPDSLSTLPTGEESPS